MAVDPLDYQGIMAELTNGDGSWNGLHPETVLGHMHLHVSQLSESVIFYQEIIGLDLMATMMGSAAFLSAGGYHHHLGINTWNGTGAPPPPPNAVGLRYFTINLSGSEDKNLLAGRLREAGIQQQVIDQGLYFEDPSGNGIVVA